MCNQNCLKGLLKHILLSPISRVSGLVGLGWSLRIYISNKFPADADIPIWGPHFENFSSKRKWLKSRLQAVLQWGGWWILSSLPPPPPPPPKGNYKPGQKHRTTISDLWKSNHGIYASEVVELEIRIVKILIFLVPSLLYYFGQCGSSAERGRLCCCGQKRLAKLGYGDDHAQQSC